MNSLLSAKSLCIMAALAIFAGGALYFASTMSPGLTDRGIDIRGTKCEAIPVARLSVATELETRKQKAEETFGEEKGRIADAYYAKNRELENEYHQCISRALTADPCKEVFEKIGRLHEEIIADFASEKGFNEAKFNEREEAKQEYNKCVEDTHKPEFYKEKSDACDAALATGREVNVRVREEAEAAAKVRMDAAVLNAENVFRQKQGILDAIESACNEPGQTSSIAVGPLTTETSGARIQLTSSACTGIYPGNDPDILRQISSLESQLQKAKAGGERKGLMGTEHIQEVIDLLKQELADSPRTCTVDADCGSVEPVCCGVTTVGRPYCNAGVCATEKTECVSPEICGGKPAQCIAPFVGAEQQDGISITRTIPEAGTCSQNLQTLSLEQATPDSIRYSINGTIPGWLHIDKSGGVLPGVVSVTYSCGEVQGFGPGTYNVVGSVTVYNGVDELINTIPFTVSITVTASEKTVEVIEYAGTYLLLSEVHQFDGVADECDGKAHWHANAGAARALDGGVVPDPGGCGYGTLESVPVRMVPDIRSVRGEVRGLENLQSQ